MRGKEEGGLHNNNIDPTANLKMRENSLGLAFIVLIKMYVIHFTHFCPYSASHKALRQIFMFHLCLKNPHLLLDYTCSNYYVFYRDLGVVPVAAVILMLAITFLTVVTE